METPTDMEIVRRVQTGDAEAFGELVNRYSGRIYALGAGDGARCAAGRRCHAGGFYPRV